MKEETKKSGKLSKIIKNIQTFKQKKADHSQYKDLLPDRGASLDAMVFGRYKERS